MEGLTARVDEPYRSQVAGFQLLVRQQRHKLAFVDRDAIEKAGFVVGMVDNHFKYKEIGFTVETTDFKQQPVGVV